MWLGLLYLPASAGGEVVLCAWERGRDRPFTVAGPLRAVPEMAHTLRRAGSAAGSVELPRCDECLTPLDLPPL